MLKDIFLQSNEFATFLKSLKHSSASHSYLIVSKDAFSANEMASLFAQAILCEKMCGECENCKKAEAGSHPDIKFYPEGAKLLVDDSKKIVEESFIKPIFADKKIFIITSVDLSTEEAQNKLLKSLEEPNDCVYYILTTSNIENVLPTIRSRCNKIELPPVCEEQILPLLSGDEQTKLLAARLGGGYISKSIQLSKKENLKDIALLGLGILGELASSREAIKYVKRIVDIKSDILTMIEVMNLAIEDALILKTQKNGKIALDMFRDKISAIANDLSIKCLSNLCLTLNKAVRDLSFNVNLPLVADNLVMNILEVKYLCK